MILKSHWQKAIFGYNLRTRFSQACSFCRTLMTHKNFCFTQIPDKTNGVIFLKSPKPCFGAIFDHFWSFLPDRVFFHKIWLCHTTTIYGLLRPCQVSEKTNEPIPRKLTDRQKDGRRADGQTLFYRTLLAKARGPKNSYGKILAEWVFHSKAEVQVINLT